MKNQYFGDINDFHKYGLLRILSDFGKRSTAVCWMLTAADQRMEGKKTDYLQNASQWRHHDPQLFDILHESLCIQNQRNVRVAAEQQIVPHAVYYDQYLTDNRPQRERYFEDLYGIIRERELVFFDPDIGMEIPSISLGGRGSSKYLYWSELSSTYAQGHSVLIYQHFPREKRQAFIDNFAAEVQTKTNARVVFSFSSSNVLFLLIPADEQIEDYEVSSSRVAFAWNKRFGVLKHRQGMPGEAIDSDKWKMLQTGRKMRPFIATLNDVDIRQDGEYVSIRYHDKSIKEVRLHLGSTKRLTLGEILDLHNQILRSQEKSINEQVYIPVEVPEGNPQLQYVTECDQWIPRGQVVRGLISDGGFDGEATVEIDNKVFSLQEFGRLLISFAGWGMRITFVPEEKLNENMQVKLGEPDIDAPIGSGKTIPDKGQ